MDKKWYLEVDGIIEIPIGVSEKEFHKLFFNFLKQNNFCFGGGTKFYFSEEELDIATK